MRASEAMKASNQRAILTRRLRVNLPQWPLEHKASTLRLPRRVSTNTRQQLPSYIVDCQSPSSGLNGFIEQRVGSLAQQKQGCSSVGAGTMMDYRMMTRNRSGSESCRSHRSVVRRHICAISSGTHETMAHKHALAGFERWCEAFLSCRPQTWNLNARGPILLNDISCPT